MNTPATSSATPAPAASGRRVLVIGADDAAGAPTVSFLTQMGLEPVLLESPSVDGLDAQRDAAYAVVLPSEGLDASALMLSVGFMLAVLGRSRICLMAPAAQALPSALQGAVRVAPDDSGIWRLLLAREMKRAGLDVDLNLAI